jgi:hypothetical protein
MSALDGSRHREIARDIQTRMEECLALLDEHDVSTIAGCYLQSAIDEIKQLLVVSRGSGKVVPLPERPSKDDEGAAN